jgi:DNA-binding transcriptional ArsR family regulator
VHERVVEDRIFQALADPSRRAIFVSLTTGEAAVKDLTARFDISQPAISQHLAALKEAGLAKGRRQGRRVFWTERAGRLEQLLEEVDHETRRDKDGTVGKTT